MSEHANLSPSSAKRWLVCLGSVPLNLGAPDVPSEDADLGTAAHEVGSSALKNGTNAADYLGLTVKVKNEDKSVRREFVVTEEMASFVQVYIDTIRDKLHNGATLLVEQRLHTGLSSLLYGDVDGTGDAIVLDSMFGILHVDDLKYGMGIRVDAATITAGNETLGPLIRIDGVLHEINPQLALYGLGALNDFGMLGDFRVVRLTIHQPRLDHISTIDVPVEALRAWGDQVQAILARLDAGDNTLIPGDDQCRWCPRKSTCPALAATVESAVTNEFPIVVSEPTGRKKKPTAVLAIPTAEAIALAVSKLDLVRLWLSAVEGDARALCLEGKLPGWKMVETRQGNREWKDEAAVAEIFKKKYRMTYEEMYKPAVLISPADAEKSFKDSPLRWEALQAQIKRGNPVLGMVPDNDPRPRITKDGVLEGFSDVAQ